MSNRLSKEAQVFLASLEELPLSEQYSPGASCITPNQAGDDLDDKSIQFTEEQLKYFQESSERYLKMSKLIVEFIKESNHAK